LSYMRARKPRTSTKSVLRVLAALVSLALIAAACGSDDDSTETSDETTTTAAAAEDVDEETPSEDVDEELVARVTESKADVPFEGPADSPPAAADKNITVIACPLANEGCQRLATAVQIAGEELGWSVSIVDQGADPDAAMQLALVENPDGIVLAAIDKEGVALGLEAAAAAGIPVVSMATNNTVGTEPGDVFAEVPLDATEMGKMLGEWVVVDSGGEANVVFFNAPELQTIQDRFAASFDVIDSCTACEVGEVIDLTLASAGTQLPLLTQTAVVSNPDASHMWNPAGAFGTMQAAEVDQTDSDILVVTFDCLSSNLEQIEAGSSLTACAATGQTQGGYAAIDELNRAFNNEPPSTSGNLIPIHMIDASNIPDEGIGWEGNEGFVEAYRELWGLS
jgi:ribose transport system substrate-binding protein